MSAVCELSSKGSERQSSSVRWPEPEFVDLSESTDDDEGHQEEIATDSSSSSKEINSSSDTIRPNEEMKKTHSFSRSRPKKKKEMDSKQPIPHWFRKLLTARKQIEILVAQLEKVTQERDDLLMQQDLNQQIAGILVLGAHQEAEKVGNGLINEPDEQWYMKKLLVKADQKVPMAPKVAVIQPRKRKEKLVADLKCNRCKKKFKYGKSFLKHRSSCHKVQKTVTLLPVQSVALDKRRGRRPRGKMPVRYQCESCPKGFAYLRNYKHHNNTCPESPSVVNLNRSTDGAGLAPPIAKEGELFVITNCVTLTDPGVAKMGKEAQRNIPSHQETNEEFVVSLVSLSTTPFVPPSMTSIPSSASASRNDVLEKENSQTKKRWPICRKVFYCKKKFNKHLLTHDPTKWK